MTANLEHFPTPLDDATLYRRVLDSIVDHAIVMLDPDGLVARWNAGAERIFGYAADDIIGRHYSVLFTEDDRRANAPNAALAHTRVYGAHEFEGWHVRKDGSRFSVSTTLSTVRDEDGRLIGFAKITRDITERRATHDALMESERRFRLLVESVTDYAIYMLDPSGVVVNWNHGAERIKGYRANEIIGRHFSCFYAPEDRAVGLPFRNMEIAAREGRLESEGWRIRKDGSRFWASVVIETIRSESGELLGFAKITRDVTEREAAQEALRESERELRLLIDGVADYALVMLDPNGMVTSWNVGAERIKGYHADEIIGQHFSRFYTDAERSAGVPANALNRAAQEGKFETEGWRVRKDGSLFWASVIIDSVHDEAGTLIGYAKITRDITERREAQLALQKAQHQLAHSQKMEALGQLTGGIAHDFNNLLTIVSGHLQIMRRLVPDDLKIKRAVDAIEQAVKRGATLTRQLLGFSRQQRLEPTAVDLQKHLTAFRDMLSSSAGGSVDIRLGLPRDVWPVMVDPSELELALVNIVLNARDAMPDGGIVTVCTENVHLERNELGLSLSGDFVALTISDSGMGIPEDILPNVFDPFFTTKRPDKGTGLGLSQVYGFAHQSGGTVLVNSKVGVGTTFTLCLPRALAEPTSAAKENSDADVQLGGTILLVEDNPEVATVSAALLEQLGYRVRTVGDAETALEVLAQDGSYDLVFSDIVMSGKLDGLGLARLLRERYPKLPVVLTTGYSKAAEAARGEFRILHKPYELPDLARALGRALADARGPANEQNLIRLDAARLSRAAKSETR